MKKLLMSAMLGLSLIGSVVYADDWKPYDANGKVLRTDRDATGKNAVVSTARYEASKIGLDILKKGGNAIDAAVAAGFALATGFTFSTFAVPLSSAVATASSVFALSTFALAASANLRASALAAAFSSVVNSGRFSISATFAV